MRLFQTPSVATSRPGEACDRCNDEGVAAGHSGAQRGGGQRGAGRGTARTAHRGAGRVAATAGHSGAQRGEAQRGAQHPYRVLPSPPQQRFALGGRGKAEAAARLHVVSVHTNVCIVHL